MDEPIKDNEQKLDAAIEHMLALEHPYELALNSEATAEHKFEQDFAHAIMSSNGANAEIRKANATLAVTRQAEAHLKAKAVVKFLGVKMKNAQMAVSARQSILSNEKNRNF